MSERQAAQPDAARMPYLPALDGIRALAVLAVVLYHAGALWLPAGFLGVDVFFVVSGFLITALLVAERERAAASSCAPSGCAAHAACCPRSRSCWP